MVLHGSTPTISAASDTNNPSTTGHYVPAVTWRIFRANRDKEPWVKACLNLKGFAIGALRTLVVRPVGGNCCRRMHARVTSMRDTYFSHLPVSLTPPRAGNGLTDPAIQYGAYADFAALNGLISEDARQLILSAFPACKAAIDVCNGHEYAYKLAVFGLSIACPAVLVHSAAA